MDELNRKLLTDAVSRHEACLRSIADMRDQAAVVDRLITMESEAWSETSIEVENRPLEYRHLLSLLGDLALIEKRYGDCDHVYLKEIVAQRYAEILRNVTDITQLVSLAVHAHPDLRRLVILRFQELLPQALASVTSDNLPTWFVHLLRQPFEITNFLSEASCKAVIEKAQALLRA
jgi:hypothetical protein